jgi:hypothetical protein
MSIDRRLREAFLATGQETEGAIDVEHHLRRAVTRARPREIGRAAAAVALVVALVAIPVVLSKPAKSTSTSGATATPAAAAGALADLKPIVSVTSASAQSERKSVTRLSRKNPFEPLGQQSGTGGGGTSGLAATASLGAGAGGGTATTTGGTGTSGTTTDTSGSTGGSSTGSTDSGSTGSTDSGSTVFYYTYVADVTFGEVDKTKQYDVRQLRALPSSDLPVVVFMGATSEGDTAVFLVGSGAAVTGEGKCKPSDDNCVFLYLKTDETVSIAVGDATGALTTYELKLREIKVKKLDQPATASGASASRASKKATARSRARARHARAKGFFQLFG